MAQVKRIRHEELRRQDKQILSRYNGEEDFDDIPEPEVEVFHRNSKTQTHKGKTWTRPPDKRNFDE